MKRLFTVFAITMLATQYVTAGSLRPRLKRDAKSPDNDTEVKNLMSDVLKILLRLPGIGELLTNWTEQIILIETILDRETAGSFSNIMNALRLCAKEQETLNDCWQNEMSPVMCESLPRIINYQIKDPVMRPVIEMGVNAGMNALKIC